MEDAEDIPRFLFVRSIVLYEKKIELLEEEKRSPKDFLKR